MSDAESTNGMVWLSGEWRTPAGAEKVRQRWRNRQRRRRADGSEARFQKARMTALLGLKERYPDDYRWLYDQAIKSAGQEGDHAK